MAGPKEHSRGEAPGVDQAVDDIRDEARKVADSVKDEVEDRAERWSDTLGRRGESLARALHSASDTLRDEGEGGLADLADRAARHVHRMGRYLEDENPSGMMDDLEDTGRSNPAAFLGIAFAAGVLGGRLLRASSPANGAAGGEADGMGRTRDLEDQPGVTHPPVQQAGGQSAVTGGATGDTGPMARPVPGSGGGAGTPATGAGATGAGGTAPGGSTPGSGRPAPSPRTPGGR